MQFPQQTLTHVNGLLLRFSEMPEGFVPRTNLWRAQRESLQDTDKREQNDKCFIPRCTIAVLAFSPDSSQVTSLCEYVCECVFVFLYLCVAKGILWRGYMNTKVHTLDLCIYIYTWRGGKFNLSFPSAMEESFFNLLRPFLYLKSLKSQMLREPLLKKKKKTSQEHTSRSTFLPASIISAFICIFCLIPGAGQCYRMPCKFGKQAQLVTPPPAHGTGSVKLTLHEAPFCPPYAPSCFYFNALLHTVAASPATHPLAFSQRTLNILLFKSSLRNKSLKLQAGKLEG